MGANFPASMIPDDVESMLKSDNYELQFVCSDYKTATDEVNEQIRQVDEIVKTYGKENMVIGEAPLTKDLADVTDVDLKNVNLVSIAAIFLIIMIVFKSISLPVVLVAIIEFAIFVNMGDSVLHEHRASLCCQHRDWNHTAGATVDYAILMTSEYQKARYLGGLKDGCHF